MGKTYYYISYDNNQKNEITYIAHLINFGFSLFQKKQAQKQIRLKKLRKLRRLRRIRDRKLRKKEELQNSGQQEQQLSN